ncbi:DUF5994 family protein [Streptomyces sp. NPDC002758]
MDGAWRPRSRDLLSELPALADALDPRGRPLSVAAPYARKLSRT